MSGFQKQWIENRGITIIRKCDPAQRRNRPSKVALVHLVARLRAGDSAAAEAYALALIGELSAQASGAPE